MLSEIFEAGRVLEGASPIHWRCARLSHGYGSRKGIYKVALPQDYKPAWIFGKIDWQD